MLVKLRHSRNGGSRMNLTIFASYTIKVHLSTHLVALHCCIGVVLFYSLLAGAHASEIANIVA